MSFNKSALVVVADGAEEMEAVITIDVLRRAGISVCVAGLGKGSKDIITCSRQIKLVPDCSLSEVSGEKFDAIVLPGGLGGAKALAASDEVGQILKSFEKKDIIAAICAGPIALRAHSIGTGKCLTSHPSVKDELISAGYQYSENRVVNDGNLITSRGPGTAFEFALSIVEALVGTAKRNEIITPMLLKL